MKRKPWEPEQMFSEYEAGRTFKAGLGRHGLYAVSYTHLDVYKRQGLYDDCVQQVKFNEAADKTAYVAHVCSSFSYRRICPIARLLEEKWS